MALPGTKSPPNRLPKKGAETKLSVDGKLIKSQRLTIGEPADIGPAPAHRRLYARDYKKTGTSPDDKDYVTGALGNPLKL